MTDELERCTRAGQAPGRGPSRRPGHPPPRRRRPRLVLGRAQAHLQGGPRLLCAPSLPSLPPRRARLTRSLLLARSVRLDPRRLPPALAPLDLSLLPLGTHPSPARCAQERVRRHPRPVDAPLSFPFLSLSLPLFPSLGSVGRSRGPCAGCDIDFSVPSSPPRRRRRLANGSCADRRRRRRRLGLLLQMLEPVRRAGSISSASVVALSQLSLLLLLASHSSLLTGRCTTWPTLLSTTGSARCVSLSLLSLSLPPSRSADPPSPTLSRPQVIEREMFRLRSTYGPEALPVPSSLALAALRDGALRGKVVLVTGGTKGLGREFAVRAAGEGGARVVVGARGSEGVREVVEEIRSAGGCVSSSLLGEVLRGNADALNGVRRKQRSDRARDRRDELGVAGRPLCASAEPLSRPFLL